MKRKPKTDVIVLLSTFAAVVVVVGPCFGSGSDHPPPPAPPPSGPTIVYMTIGMAGRVTCLVEPLPPSRLILWMKDGQMMDVTSPDERVSVDSNGDLVISDVIDSDDGTYVCMAYSPLETGHASVTFEVIVKGLHYFTVRPLPVYHRMAGDSVTMPCHSEGDPTPNIFWRRLDGGGFPSSTRTLQDSGNLTIVQLTSADDGLYACIASNVVTSIITTTILVVQIRLITAPFNVTVAMTPNSARLSWIPPYGKFGNGHYVIWFRRHRRNSVNRRRPEEVDDDEDDAERKRKERKEKEDEKDEEEEEADEEDGEDEDEYGMEDWQTMEAFNSREMLSMTVHGLIPSSIYSFMLMSRDSHGDPHFSEQIEGATGEAFGIFDTDDLFDPIDDPGHDVSDQDDFLDIRPSPPSDLSARLLSDSKVNISWRAPRSTPIPVQHYVVEYRSTAEWRPVIDLLPPRNTSLLWQKPRSRDPEEVLHFRVFSFGGVLHSVASPVASLFVGDGARDGTGDGGVASAGVAWETVGGAFVGLVLVSGAIFFLIFAFRLYNRRIFVVKENLQQPNDRRRTDSPTDQLPPLLPPPQPLLLPPDGVYQRSGTNKYESLSELEWRSKRFIFLCNSFGIVGRIWLCQRQLCTNLLIYHRGYHNYTRRHYTHSRANYDDDYDDSLSDW